MREDDLIAVITAAFDGVPPPGPGHRDLFDAEAASSGEAAMPHPPHPPRWQDLPPSVLEATPWALGHLDAEGLCYALPAVLCADLRAARDQTHPPFITDTLAWQLAVLDPDSRDHTVQRLAGLGHLQRRAVAAWVAVRSRDPALQAAWARLAAAEADTPCEDWADVLHPPRPVPDPEAVAAALWAVFPEHHPWRAELAEALADPARAAHAPIVRRLHPDLRHRSMAEHQAAIADLDWPQRRALLGFVMCCLPTPARAKWVRLATAEADAPRPDWLDILYTPPPT